MNPYKTEIAKLETRDCREANRSWVIWRIVGVVSLPFLVGGLEIYLDKLGFLNKKDGWPVGADNLTVTEWCFNIWTADLVLGFTIVCSLSSLAWILVRRLRKV